MASGRTPSERNSWQLRTLSALKRCRTSDLGGHIDACTDCATVRISYNSCRNRHCNECTGPVFTPLPGPRFRESLN
uniref:transposase zinc-binding domain-containing protein n=1 Tax=Anditalea andensis TaxID=1048983 RepID=UPI00373FDE5C